MTTNGNDGTIKIQVYDTTTTVTTIDNDPHVQCGVPFSVVGFGFAVGGPYSLTIGLDTSSTGTPYTSHPTLPTPSGLPGPEQLTSIVDDNGGGPSASASFTSTEYTIYAQPTGTNTQTNFLIEITDPGFAVGANGHTKTKVLHVDGSCQPPVTGCTVNCGTSTPELGSGELLATGLIPVLALGLYRRQRNRNQRRESGLDLTPQEPLGSDTGPSSGGGCV